MTSLADEELGRILASKSPVHHHHEVVMAWILQQKESKAIPVADWQSAAGFAQHRKWKRIKIKRQIAVVPLDDDCETPTAIQATTRDMSPDGLSFVCEQQLPYRRVRLEFLATDLPPLEVELTWCRFTREQQHQCGGFFVGTIEP